MLFRYDICLAKKSLSGGASRDKAMDVYNHPVEKLLSPGGSRAWPIDVDALHAVLERYPLKREPQVCAGRGSWVHIVHANPAD